MTMLAQTAHAAIRQESFDHEPADWEGINNRNTHFEPRAVTQDFGYSPSRHAGGGPGEIGGTLNERRTPNALVARINGRGETFHCHCEYGTSRWRCGAEGNGLLTFILDGETASCAIAKEHRGDGNRVTAFFDDIQYTYAPDPLPSSSAGQ